jgi:predicted alpha/beta hydrolase
VGPLRVRGRAPWGPSPGADGSEEAMTSETTYAVTTSDGWSLGVHVLPARAPRIGSALLLHAMMVDHRSMDRPRGAGLASSVRAAGFDVHLADLRGRGASGPTVAQGGAWSYDDLVFRDVPALVDAVRDRAEGPVWVVGHSLGGHVALATAAVGAHTLAPDGHVVIASNLWMPSLEGSRRRRLAKSASIQVFRQVSRAAGRFPAHALGVGPVDEALRYVEDLCDTWEHDRWWSRDEAHDYLHLLPNVAGPILCVIGRGDRLLGHVEGARAFIERAGPGRAEVLVAGRQTMPELGFDPGHMGLVTDPRCRPLWERIGAFMRAAPADWTSR